MSEPPTNPEEDLTDEAQKALEGEVADVVERLQRLVDDRVVLTRLPEELRKSLLTACGRLSRPTREERNGLKKEYRRQRRERRRAHDRALLDRTRARHNRIELVYPTPDPDGRGNVEGPLPGGLQLIDARSCYICKADYREVHSFYDTMCPECAEFNLMKRNQTADLTGRVALLTGGRVKIGYHTGIKLLRAGARLIVTTRFPRDAAMRYAAESDFSRWQDRLEIYGLDLRHTPSVEVFLEHVNENYDRLDFILNNACQTVRRPPGFFAHLMEAEELPYEDLPDTTRRLVAGHEKLRRQHGVLSTDSRGKLPEPSNGSSVVSSEQQGTDQLAGINLSAALSQVPLVPGDVDVGEHLFPEGKLDADLQQVDLREINSWRLPLAEVSTIELLEVHLVNAVAPFVFNARLKELMLRHPGRDKHIVNVSAMEGQFYRSFKTDKHPHTNMAKASLNMMTRTSAPDYERDGIHMNSVDTGWITDEDPIHITKRKQKEQGFRTPLDHVDAAARICAPIFEGISTGNHMWGQFLKDYKPTRW